MSCDPISQSCPRRPGETDPSDEPNASFPDRPDTGKKADSRMSLSSGGGSFELLPRADLALLQLRSGGHPQAGVVRRPTSESGGSSSGEHPVRNLKIDPSKPTVVLLDFNGVLDTTRRAVDLLSLMQADPNVSGIYLFGVYPDELVDPEELDGRWPTRAAEVREAQASARAVGRPTYQSLRGLYPKLAGDLSVAKFIPNGGEQEREFRAHGVDPSRFNVIVLDDMEDDVRFDLDDPAISDEFRAAVQVVTPRQVGKAHEIPPVESSVFEDWDELSRKLAASYEGHTAPSAPPVTPPPDPPPAGSGGGGGDELLPKLLLVRNNPVALRQLVLADLRILDTPVVDEFVRLTREDPDFHSDTAFAVIGGMRFEENFRSGGQIVLSTYFSRLGLESTVTNLSMVDPTEAATFMDPVWNRCQDIMSRGSNPDMRYYVLALTHEIVRKDLLRQQSLGDDPVLRIVALGMKDPDPTNSYLAWKILKMLDPAAARVVGRDSFTEGVSTASGESPEFGISPYVIDNDHQNLMRSNLFIQLLSGSVPETTVVSIDEVVPIHSLADYNPDPRHRKGIVDEKYAALRRIVVEEGEGADRERVIGRFFALPDVAGHEQSVKVLRLPSGRQFVIDGQHRMATLIRAAREGLIPSDWLDAVGPVERTTYQGDIPEAVIEHTLTLGVDLSWKDLFPESEGSPANRLTLSSGARYSFQLDDGRDLRFLPPDTEDKGLAEYRGQEVGRIVAAFRDNTANLVTLTGYPGTRKTRTSVTELESALDAAGFSSLHWEFKNLVRLVDHEGVQAQHWLVPPHVVVLDEAAIPKEQWGRTGPVAKVIGRYLAAGGRIILMGAGGNTTPETQVEEMGWVQQAKGVRLLNVPFDVKPLNSHQARDLLTEGTLLSGADKEAYTDLVLRYLPPYLRPVKHFSLRPPDFNRATPIHSFSEARDYFYGLMRDPKNRSGWARSGITVTTLPEDIPAAEAMVALREGERPLLVGNRLIAENFQTWGDFRRLVATAKEAGVENDLVGRVLGQIEMDPSMAVVEGGSPQTPQQVLHALAHADNPSARAQAYGNVHGLVVAVMTSLADVPNLGDSFTTPKDLADGIDAPLPGTLVVAELFAGEPEAVKSAYRARTTTRRLWEEVESSVGAPLRRLFEETEQASVDLRDVDGAMLVRAFTVVQGKNRALAAANPPPPPEESADVVATRALFRDLPVETGVRYPILSATEREDLTAHLAQLDRPFRSGSSEHHTSFGRHWKSFLAAAAQWGPESRTGRVRALVVGAGLDFPINEAVPFMSHVAGYRPLLQERKEAINVLELAALMANHGLDYAIDVVDPNGEVEAYFRALAAVESHRFLVADHAGVSRDYIQTVFGPQARDVTAEHLGRLPQGATVVYEVRLPREVLDRIHFHRRSVLEPLPGTGYDLVDFSLVKPHLRREIQAGEGGQVLGATLLDTAERNLVLNLNQGGTVVTDAFEEKKAGSHGFSVLRDYGSDERVLRLTHPRQKVSCLVRDRSGPFQAAIVSPHPSRSSPVPGPLLLGSDPVPWALSALDAAPTEEARAFLYSRLAFELLTVQSRLDHFFLGGLDRFPETEILDDLEKSLPIVRAVAERYAREPASLKNRVTWEEPDFERRIQLVWDPAYLEMALFLPIAVLLDRPISDPRDLEGLDRATWVRVIREVREARRQTHEALMREGFTVALNGHFQLRAGSLERWSDLGRLVTLAREHGADPLSRLLAQIDIPRPPSVEGTAGHPWQFIWRLQHGGEVRSLFANRLDVYDDVQSHPATVRQLIQVIQRRGSLDNEDIESMAPIIADGVERGLALAVIYAAESPAFRQAYVAHREGEPVFFERETLERYVLAPLRELLGYEEGSDLSGLTAEEVATGLRRYAGLSSLPPVVDRRPEERDAEVARRLNHYLDQWNRGPRRAMTVRALKAALRGSPAGLEIKIRAIDVDEAWETVVLPILEQRAPTLLGERAPRSMKQEAVRVGTEVVVARWLDGFHQPVPSGTLFQEIDVAVIDRFGGLVSSRTEREVVVAVVRERAPSMVLEKAFTEGPLDPLIVPPLWGEKDRTELHDLLAWTLPDDERSDLMTALTEELYNPYFLRAVRGFSRELVAGTATERERAILRDNLRLAFCFANPEWAVADLFDRLARGETLEPVQEMTLNGRTVLRYPAGLEDLEALEPVEEIPEGHRDDPNRQRLVFDKRWRQGWRRRSRVLAGESLRKRYPVTDLASSVSLSPADPALMMVLAERMGPEYRDAFERRLVSQALGTDQSVVGVDLAPLPPLLAGVDPLAMAARELSALLVDRSAIPGASFSQDVVVERLTVGVRQMTSVGEGRLLPTEAVRRDGERGRDLLREVKIR
ncbi:MAG: hypothetical protein HYS22_01525 [Deltaproteobacteria bacterium]|nr:hypothetical protein [Deltaproteobacteria bacterium]